ncbi:hypothetical protein NDU88_006210 [Pleurodeles waltl]|uniref:Myb-like domain-containing protein n=1 Tax=Pleurodeles waltl TaxID=8319 RepID=A0AAV7TYV4_PLEWA|nr:hypothetical protein NDU88_006210 [Pleurodeles waltl]
MVGGRRTLHNSALVNIGPYGSQEPMTMYSGGDVSAHQKKGIWRAIAKDVRTLVVYYRRSTHCRKRWEDLHRWSKKTAEAQLGWPPNVGGVPVAP